MAHMQGKPLPHPAHQYNYLATAVTNCSGVGVGALSEMNYIVMKPTKINEDSVFDVHQFGQLCHDLFQRKTANRAMSNISSDIIVYAPNVFICW